MQRILNSMLEPYLSMHSPIVARKMVCEWGFYVSARLMSPFSSLKAMGSNCSKGSTLAACARRVSVYLQICRGSILAILWADWSLENRDDRDALFLIIINQIYIYQRRGKGEQ